MTDKAKLAVLVQALREIQWFSPHHGGWAEPRDCRVKLKSGEERYFRLATYLREPGVVIDFDVPKGQIGPHAGYAYSKALPRVLPELGIDLPR